ncbi:MAG: O-antigen ligase family protein [Bryobacteraceae bacterium]
MTLLYSLRGRYMAGVVGGASLGSLVVTLSALASPVAAAGLLAGGVVVAALMAWPFLAFLLTAVVVPLERMGRLTNDSAVYTVSLMKMAGLLALGAFVVNALLRKQALRLPGPVLLYGVYIGLAFGSLAYTSDWTNSQRSLSLIIGNLLFFFLVPNMVRSKEQAQIALACWLGATLIIGLVTIAQFHNPSAVVEDSRYYQGSGVLTTGQRFDMVVYDGLVDSPERSKRAIGTTSHPAVYAINLILAVPFYAYFLRVAAKPWMQWLAALSGLVCLYNILLANTRAAILTVAFVFVCMIVTGLFRVNARMIAGAALAAGLILVANPKDIWNRALNFSTYSTNVGVMEERFHMWRAAVGVIADNWLLGTGTGNMKEVPSRVRVKVSASSTHNDVLALLVEVGLVGFSAMTVFLLSLHRRCRKAERSLRALGDDSSRWLFVAARVMLYSVLLYGVQVETLSLPLKGFWLAMGVVVALSELLNRQIPRPAGSSGIGKGVHLYGAS